MATKTLALVDMKPGERVILTARKSSRLVMESPEKPKNVSGYSVGDLRMDLERGEVYVGKREVKLPPAEFDILEKLLKREGRIASREFLRGDTDSVDNRSVDQGVSRLRRKLGSEGYRIETVVNRGYKLRLK